MTRSNFFYIVHVFLVFCLITGCVNPPSGSSEKHYYTLEANRTADSLSPKGSQILRVQRFRMANQFNRGELVYRINNVEYESDFYNVFFSPPASLITEQTESWLSSSGLFSAVVTPASQVSPDLVMEGCVLEFYGDFRTIANPKAVLKVQVLLIDRSVSSCPIVFDRTYNIVKPLQSNHAEAIVHGLNDSLTEFFTFLEQDLLKALKP